MSWINLSRALATASALLFAFGCASSSTVSTVQKSPAPVEEPQSTGRVATLSTSSTTLDPVYFGTDSPLLRPDTRDALKRHSKAILEHPEWGVVRIDGHCDERGSEEYNLALGERRAAAVKGYLVDLGVPGSRLTTRTFGESLPAIAGHSESAWRYNRRSELAVEALAAATR